MKKLIMIFVDGIGLGADTPENPIRRLFSESMEGTSLSKVDTPVFFKHGVLIPTDPILGIQGIPQSATGQTSIFTGINAQKFIGTHLSAFPNSALVKIIQEKSLMKILKKTGISVTAANLYSNEFFKERENKRKNMLPVSTLTIMSSGVPFRFKDDYLNEKAVFADITNQLLIKRGYPVKLIKPETAAKRIVNILEDFEFVFFEYFMTDFYGHKKDRKALNETVNTLNDFAGCLWRFVKDNNTAILIVSDHGNAEDMATGDHTLNPVPTIFLSKDEKALMKFSKQIKNLTDIYKAVCGYFRN